MKKDCSGLLDKPELRDHHVSAAWDLIEAGDVHDA